MIIKNLIEIAKNFIGTKGFSNYFDKEGNDILKNGDLSCSIFISTILVIVRVIDGVSFTVNGLINRIEHSNNFKKINNNLNISDLQKGDIIIWNSIDGDENGHVGIYTGGGFTISNMSSKGRPGSHAVIYKGLSKDKKNRNSEIKLIYRLKI